MYRAVTIPQAMRLNAMLTKKQVCGCIRILLLEFKRLSRLVAAGRALWRLGAVVLPASTSA
jgi:hypothetical protein